MKFTGLSLLINLSNFFLPFASSFQSSYTTTTTAVAQVPQRCKTDNDPLKGLQCQFDILKYQTSKLWKVRAEIFSASTSYQETSTTTTTTTSFTSDKSNPRNITTATNDNDNLDNKKTSNRILTKERKHARNQVQKYNPITVIKEPWKADYTTSSKTP